ncbi:DUF308 domain-containing protein [Oricola cellulosilytica]|uniref:Uncharacterized protein n=1 Tax=Oricola cellulosilytica TaxID=1429082 RepID=A0A4R0PI41_9HYPH|nr:DUF308 domain-containing protein [Oricola cellulosilytica]TCD16414.1 hypothetical protein E0D97_03020 [Oricola cellulosilytica]
MYERTGEHGGDSGRGVEVHVAPIIAVSPGALACIFERRDEGAGILQRTGLIGGRHVPHFWLQLISGALSLIVFFIVGGMAKIVFALTTRPFPHWGWILGSGIVGLGLGVILFAQMPVTAA